MAKVIKRIEACYQVEVVEMGKVYRWCPESLLVECDCGEETSLTASNNTCAECGADYRGIVEGVLDSRPEDKVEHPWRSLHPYYTPISGA